MIGGAQNDGRRRLATLFFLVLTAGALWGGYTSAQTSGNMPSRMDRLERDVQQLDNEVRRIRSDVVEYGGGGFILFLTAAFCALWAQNTGRNAWLWFFVGLFFHIGTIFVLLYKNATDLRPPQPYKPLK